MRFAYHGITDSRHGVSPGYAPKCPAREQVAAPKMSPDAGEADTLNAIAAAAEGTSPTQSARLESRGFKPAALMIDSA